MKYYIWLLFFLSGQFSFAVSHNDEPIQANVTIQKQYIISKEFPAIQIQVADSFQYVGSFQFTIDDLAAGERYLFIHTNGRKVLRMFIAQFERFNSSSEEIYRYNFDNALQFGNHKFKQNTFAYSSAEAQSERPSREAALTTSFIEKKGYFLEDIQLVSRFVTLGNPDRKSELILFYTENLSSTEYKVEDLFKDGNGTENWISFSKELTERAFKAFTIVK